MTALQIRPEVTWVFEGQPTKVRKEQPTSTAIRNMRISSSLLLPTCNSTLHQHTRFYITVIDDVNRGVRFSKYRIFPC